MLRGQHNERREAHEAELFASEISSSQVYEI
jgi:hypothetical protein